MAEEYSALPPEAPPQVPGFEAPGYAGGFSLNPTEQDINRLYPVAPEPDIPIPQYISSVPPYSAAEVPPPEDYLSRPNYENMFSVVYQPTVASNPVVGWIAGVIVENGTVINVPAGSVPGTFRPVDPQRRAPLDENITWYLNVMENRQASKVSTTKDPEAEFCIPVAKMTSGCNGFIQQLHRGAVFLSAAGGFQVIPKVENQVVTSVKVKAGNVYFRGRKVGTSPEMEMAFTNGDLYLVVTFDIWGDFVGTRLERIDPGIDPFMLSFDALGKEGIYVFHLANIKVNGTVTQYTIGDVYCNFDPGTFFTPGPAS